MNYQLNSNKQYKSKGSIVQMLKKFIPLLKGEKRRILVAGVALLVTISLNLVSPYIIGRTIDTYIKNRDFGGVLFNAGILLALNVVMLVSSYIQTKNMGTVGQQLLLNLRNSIFLKLQDLPIAFFNQNKAGDLISRINSDTDNLNQFFSQVFMQFVGNIFIMIGAALFLLGLNIELGLLALLPALGILIFTRLVSPQIRKKNTTMLQSVGTMSGEIQESLGNFKVIVAFNRRDYFKERFSEVNQTNYQNAIRAGLLNNLLTPVYGLGANIAQIIVLLVGITMIVNGNFTIGLLVSYLGYISRFYDPVRQIAGFWATVQNSLGSWDRISEILALKSDLVASEDKKKNSGESAVMEFRNVSFHYPDGENVLNKINFSLEKGKSYAFVGPTGGGKTTTASLMARLYDPSHGTVYFEGKNLQSYTAGELSEKIGFILQDPFLFSGTIRDNILYGSSKYGSYTNEQTVALLKEYQLEGLLQKFDQGIETTVNGQGDSISLGQRQLIAFMRAVLRQPELLILDEATANVDTVTEQLLEKILDKLPKSTSKVIIAHRLNTIEDADEIFFVNGGEIAAAGSIEQALHMLMTDTRKS